MNEGDEVGGAGAAVGTKLGDEVGRVGVLQLDLMKEMLLVGMLAALLTSHHFQRNKTTNKTLCRVCRRS